jgi:5-methylcytosine-specific restriction endonuclease McrA
MARLFNPNTYHGWRKLVLARDNHACVVCGAKEGLECDHIKPYRNFPELQFLVSNGRVLCKACHKKTDTYGGKLLKGTTLNRNPYGPG